MAAAPDAPAEASPHRRAAKRSYAPEPAQGWLALFFDLAFVAAIVVLSTSYSANYSLWQSIWLIGVFTLIWTTWLLTTLRMLATPIRGTWPRALIVTQMALVLLLALVADEFVDNIAESVGGIFAAILAVAVLLNRALTQPGDPDHLTRGQTGRLAIAGALFIATWWVNDGSPESATIANALQFLVLWAIGLALVVWTLHSRVNWAPGSDSALGHRAGEFTIIVLGESFLKIALVINEESLDEINLVALPLTFGIITALWWLYFAHVAQAGVPAARGWWLALHLPLHLFMVALAVGLSKLLLTESSAYTNSGFGLIPVPLVGVLLCLGALIRIGGGQVARRGLWVLVAGCGAIVAIVALNYLGRGQEFDLTGTVLLIGIVLAAVIRGVGQHAPPDPDAGRVAVSARPDTSGSG